MKSFTRMNFRILFIFSLIFSPVFPGCAMAPKTFVRTMEPGWAYVEMKEGVTYEAAWESIVDMLTKKFDIEMLAKADGYIRTGWIYTWTGQMQENYRVRTVIKFTQDRRTIGIKGEAQYQSRGSWEVGTDDMLMSTLKTDIMGALGRVTR